MRKLFNGIFLSAVLFLFTAGCGGREGNESIVVIGIDSGVETLNPMFVMSEPESNICDLIYLPLVSHSWDNNSGEILSQPLLANSVLWNKDSSSVKIILREDARWSDGEKLTAEDVVFTFGLYSDPDVQSRFFGMFKNLYLNDDFSVDLEKSFTVINQSEFVINFIPGSSPSYFDFDYPIIPKHIFGKVNRKRLSESDSDILPVGSGAYKLKSYEKNRTVILQLDSGNFLAKNSSPSEIIFKIIPDYNSRINQLKNGEIDFTENVRAEDLDGLKSIDDLAFAFRKGREYDYLGLNNIDAEEYAAKDRIEGNKYFSRPEVRLAFAYAIDRQSILDQFLLGQGQLMTGPVAPIFKQFNDTTLIPYKYDPAKAALLLNEAGWSDSDKDGIVDKNGQKFSFTLYVPSGNPLRNNTATIIKNNLISIGVDAKIEMLEPAVLTDKMFSHAMDAWISGWGVAIPLDLKPYWHSDFEQAPANTAGYINKDVDNILDKLEGKINNAERARLLKELQGKIFKDEPVVFLFWLNNIAVYNKRIENINITPLNSVVNCWDWQISK